VRRSAFGGHRAALGARLPPCGSPCSASGRDGDDPSGPPAAGR
jgi:hypothetical protein